MTQLQIDTLKEMKMNSFYYAIPERYYEFFDELVNLGYVEKKIWNNSKNIYKKIKDIT